MGPEMWIALAAVFVSGGAVGTAGTLLTQWLVGRFEGSSSGADGSNGPGLDALRSEVHEMGRHLRNLDARLDFTERLLDGALAPGSGPDGAGEQPGEPRSEG